MMRWVITGRLFALAFLATLSVLPGEFAHAETCESAVGELNQVLSSRVDERELASILVALNESGNRRLPPKFVSKARARKMGWRPGRDLWEHPSLDGKSIGGDFFGNRERKLPNGKRVWHEADLDYRGGRRGPKRILYSNDGLRFVTVDHYRNFKEVPPCR